MPTSRNVPTRHARRVLSPFDLASILPTVRHRPTAARLSQRTLMDGLNPIAVSRVVLRGLECLPRSPIAREVLPLITRSPRGNLACHPNLSAVLAPNVGRPGPTLPVRFPCLPSTLDTPLSCLEQALGDPHHVPKRCTFGAGIVSLHCRCARGGPAGAHRSCPPYNRLKNIFHSSMSRHYMDPRSARFCYLPRPTSKLHAV
ncbi:UNVERIFIED_CONTAM: hypothetical protein Sradi_1557700 [Sesamum radiatum]|uniref:Uncharacterized protein n=1 Tax=Sesamum radiatum TaxID=300843 RepID=A0AAW2U8J1_SESRA